MQTQGDERTRCQVIETVLRVENKETAHLKGMGTFVCESLDDFTGIESVSQ